MKDIIVKNKKILDFYSQNPGINFEAVNLIFVDLFERLLGDMNSAMNSTINSQILSTVGDLKGEFTSLSSSVSKLNSDITNSIYIKFQESKREYVDDITNIVSNNFSQNSDKMNSLLQQNTSQLIDKTSLLLNEVIPKSNDSHHKQIQDSIYTFQKSISEDTTKLLHSINKEDSLSTFISNFETKSTNMLQPLFSFINASEERINKNVISLKDATNNSAQDKIMNELSEFLGKYKNSSYKGQFGENQLETVLNQLFLPLKLLTLQASRHHVTSVLIVQTNPPFLSKPKIMIETLLSTKSKSLLETSRNKNVMVYSFPNIAALHPNKTFKSISRAPISLSMFIMSIIVPIQSKSPLTLSILSLIVWPNSRKMLMKYVFPKKLSMTSIKNILGS